MQLDCKRILRFVFYIAESLRVYLLSARMSVKYFVIAAVLLSVIGTTVSIKCWVCNSAFDLGCGDPFDNSSFPISDCNSAEHRKPHLGNAKATMCRKMVQKVNGYWRYIRSCAFLGEPGIGGDERFCKRRTGTYDIYIEDCTCTSKDGCNTSSLTVRSWLYLVLFVSLMTFALK